MKQLQSFVGKPFERQPRESVEAFEAFQLFRTMGLDRNQRKVSDQLGKAEQLISRWACAYLWRERARLWDNECDRELQEKDKRERKAITDRYVTQARLMQSKGLEALMHLQTTVETKAGTRGILKARDCVALIKAGIDVERLMLGDPKEDPITKVEIIIEEAKESMAS